MATADQVGQAAGEAAYDEAESSSWPPDQGDFEAIGAAAGAAAGAVLGGPAGAALGGVVGAAVGNAVFQLGDAIAGGLDPSRNLGPELFNVTRYFAANAGPQAADELAMQCGTDRETEIAALQRWGARIDETGHALDWRHWVRYVQEGNMGAWQAGTRKFQKQLFVSAAARSAECAAVKEQSSSSGTVKAVALGAGVIGGLWLLAKFL